MEDTANYLRQIIDEGLISMQAATQIPVAFTPVLGLDLAVYSPSNTRAIYQQPIIDQSVLQINRYIYSVNAANHVPTPLLESTIHKQKGKNRVVINHYAKLQDGAIRTLQQGLHGHDSSLRHPRNFLNSNYM